jgi:hypothetical protein
MSPSPLLRRLAAGSSKNLCVLFKSARAKPWPTMRDAFFCNLRFISVNKGDYSGDLFCEKYA